MSSDNQKPPSSPMQRDPDGTGVFVIDMKNKQDGVSENKTYKLHKRRVVIGSALSSDIRIQQSSVSNLHAIIEIDDNHNATIYDMASASGVFVNGEKVTSQAIKPGDKIRIGFAELNVSNEDLKTITAKLPPKHVKTSGRRQLFLDEEEDFRPLILEDERNVIPIFDYPDQAEKSIQVVHYWGSVLLDVQHHPMDASITAGEDKSADLVVPGLLDPLTLIETDGGAVVLNLRKDMRGVIRSKNQLIPVDEYCQSIASSPSGLKRNLRVDDLIKLELGEQTLFISYSPKPPKLKPQRVLERDPLFTKLWSLSLIMTMLLIGLIWSVAPPEELEVDEIPERTATIIFKPKPIVQLKQRLPKKLQKTLPAKPKRPKPVAKKEPPKKEPPKPKPPQKTEPKKVVDKRTTKPTKEKPKISKKNVPFGNKQAAGNEGEGARAAGKEGKRGTKTATKQGPPQYKYRPKAGARARSAGGGRNAGPNAGKGNVDVLKGLKGFIDKTLTKGSAGLSRAGGGGQAGNSGFGEFDTQGQGGLGETGTGRGGGGKSQTIAGLGNKGLGGGKKGTGRGDLGTGGELVGGQPGRPVVQVGDDTETVVMGGLDRGVIDRIVKTHIPAIRYCWEKEGNPNLSGRVATRWVISPSGRVENAAVRSSSLSGSGGSNVANCLRGIIKRMIFPKPLGGGKVEVDYPFIFGPALRN